MQLASMQSVSLDAIHRPSSVSVAFFSYHLVEASEAIVQGDLPDREWDSIVLAYTLSEASVGILHSVSLQGPSRRLLCRWGFSSMR
jgi:hypothetical protein